MRLHNLLADYERRFRPFTEHEAWTLFRLAAFAEAIGWTLLITGIGIKQYVVKGNNIPVLIAGQLHGTLFIIYIAAAILLYPSLGWRRPMAIIAGMASVPPYGSLVFEQYMAYRRQQAAASRQKRLITYRRLLEVAA